MEVSCDPSGYSPVLAGSASTKTTQTVIYNQTHEYYYDSVTYELYADGEATGKKVTLDLTTNWRTKPENWVARWSDLPVYRLDEKGQIYKEDAADTDYARVEYKVKLVDSVISSWQNPVEPPSADPNELHPVSMLIPVTTVSRAEFTNEYHAEGEYELKGSKEIRNRDFQSGDAWTFTVTAAEGTPMPEHPQVTVRPINGVTTDVDFGKINYTEDDIAKTYTYTITESGQIAGVTNDASPTRTVKVEVTDNGDGTLSATSTSDSQNLNFTNTYKSSGTAEFKGQKTLESRAFNDDDELTVTVEGKDGAKVPNPDRINVGLASGENTAAFAFAPITFTHEDLAGKDSAEFEYIVTETPTMAGTTQKGSVHTVKVTVSEHTPKDGELDVDISYADGDKVGFINTYSATGGVTIEGEKTIQNRPFQNGDTLTVAVSADEGVKLPSPATKTITLTNGQNTAAFDFGAIEYTLDDMKDASGKLLEEKTFVYTVTETANMKGTTADAGEHTVTVKLTDNKKGSLVPEVTYSDGEQVEFTNTYAASGSITLGGTKTIQNRNFKAGDSATFKIEAVTEGAPMPKKNGEIQSTVTVEPTSGNEVSYQFAPIVYKLSDVGANNRKVFEYKITESDFRMDGVTKDTNERTVRVTVVDNGTGELAVTSDMATNPADFTNTYDATGEIELTGTKTIAGRPFKEGDTATFTVESLDGAPAPENPVVTIEPTTGSTAPIDFGKIAFKLSDLPGGAGSEKTFNYKVTESACSMDGVTKDSEVYEIAVTVTDNNSGDLTVRSNIDTKKLDFTNTYDASGSIALGGTKFISNRAFKDGDTATIKIEAITNGAPMPSEHEVTVSPDEDTSSQSYSFGAITYTLAHAGGANSEATYQYKVTESACSMAGVTKDSKEYTVTVTVKDDSTGALTVTADNQDALDFTNVYNATGSTVLKATKKIQNRKFLASDADKWTFAVSAADGVPLPDPSSVVIEPTVGDNSYDFEFAIINYDESDIGKTYTYIITESGEVAGVTNAAAQAVTVKVEDNKDGTLKVTREGGGQQGRDPEGYQQHRFGQAGVREHLRSRGRDHLARRKDYRES